MKPIRGHAACKMASTVAGPPEVEQPLAVGGNVLERFPSYLKLRWVVRG